MARFTNSALASAVAWTFLSPAAFADLTAEQVWGDWRDYMQGLGYTVTANENMTSGQLAITDMRVDMPMGNDQMALSIGTLTFIETSDGAVEILMPGVLPLALEMSPKGKPPATINFSYTQSGQSLKVSGDPENLTYDYIADSIAIALDQVIADGEALGPENARFNISANDVKSNTVMTIGDLRSYRQTMAATGLQYDFFMQEPGATESFQLTGQNDRLAFDATSDVPLGVATVDGDMSALLNAGFDLDARIAFGAGAYNANVKGPAGPVDLSGSADGSTLNIKMSGTGLAYSGGQTNLQVNAQLPDLPFPISLALAKNGFSLMMPVSKSDAAQDFAFAFNMTGFTMADGLWGIFDPSEQLPRDPATIALDLTGKVKLLMDFMNPSAAAAMEQSGAKPGELEAVTINELTVDAVGAKLSGTGDFIFDNTDMITVPGMPKPIGSINLSIEGANGLIDKLIAMGILPQEQAMGARMMMGMLTVPGSEPDTMTSKIEMTAEGQILANGQRIK